MAAERHGGGVERRSRAAPLREFAANADQASDVKARDCGRLLRMPRQATIANACLQRSSDDGRAKVVEVKKFWMEATEASSRRVQGSSVGGSSEVEDSLQPGLRMHWQPAGSR